VGEGFVSLYFRLIWPWVWKIRSSFSKKDLSLGQTLPDFNLYDLSGKPHRLSDALPEKGAILWLTNLCVECEKKISFLDEIRRAYGSKWEIFAISTLGENRQKAEDIKAKHSFGYPLLLDPKDWTSHTLGLEHQADACPLFNLLVVDSGGHLRFKTHLSAIPEETLRKVLTVEEK
jgi:peroxiredoxin